uniref:Uncharacterized protein n=1 Tax=Candidatus Kentrum sp. LFY TaxID=2126342 RepID=A0A450UFS2_9GAMM|nr:MAG: hypothetical protein BECKLFY1418A_GA0070994_101515 [Candidatus Kentron sp. LFY]
MTKIFEKGVILQNSIFEEWVDGEAERASSKLDTEEPLTRDDKLVIALKEQINHSHRLNEEFRQEINGIRAKMDDIDKVGAENTKSVYQMIHSQYQTINAQWKMIYTTGLIVGVVGAVTTFFRMND